jgi:hypothetical protein
MKVLTETFSKLEGRMLDGICVQFIGEDDHAERLL